MSKKFEYELTLRLEKAEKSIASLASKIEKDLGKAVETAFRGASEFDVVKFSKNIGSRIEQDVSSALKSAFSGSSEFDFGKRIAAGIEKDVSQAVKAAFSGSSEFDFADPGKAEADSQKRIQQIRADSEARNQIAEQDYQRDIQRSDGVAAHLAEKRKEAEAAVAQENQDMASRAAQRDKLEEAHTSRLSKNSALLKEYYATYKDPSALNAIQTVEKSLERHSESLKSSGLSLTEQKKVHDDYTKSKLDALDKLTGKEQKATSDRIAQIRSTEAADKAARDVRYKDHQQVLSIISQAEQQNAQQLIGIEQRITTMTKAEAKEQLDAYRKLAKARIDYAVEAGYAMEAESQRQSATGARGISAIFQVQQAVEDSMYAGLRGAGNNIAFLLTSISNQWVAIGGLIGIATLQLAAHLGVFDKINESMDGMLWKTKEQIRQEEYLVRLRKEGFERNTKQQIDAANFDPSGKTPKNAENDLNDAKNELSVLQQREDKLRTAISLQKEIGAVLTDIMQAGKDGRNPEQLYRQLDQLFGLYNKLGPEFRQGTDELLKHLEDVGSESLGVASKVKVLEDQLNKVREAYARTQEQEALKEAALENIEAQIEASQAVVKTREDELRTVQQTLATAEQLLKTEQNREDTIRKAASAREDEFAKQKLGLQNTLLDMEASETVKNEKAKADSAKANVASQMESHRKWAEKQAQIDKFNNKGNSANIDAAKQNWLSNMQAQADAEIARIEANEQRAIESAKKIAEATKKANLDAMEVVQKKKVEDLLEESSRRHGDAVSIFDPLPMDGKKEAFDDAQQALDEAKKTLKEMADAKVGNLNQKDSVQQGKDALREWEEITKQIKTLDERKADLAKSAQAEFLNQPLWLKAQEDQAAARLEQAKAAHDVLLEKKQQINKVPLIDPADLESVAKFRRELEAILGLRIQINGAGVPAQGPMLPPMPVPGGGGVGGAPAVPTTPGTPGPQFNMNFSMGSATPNAVAAAASSIVQTQKTLAMLGGN